MNFKKIAEELNRLSSNFKNGKLQEARNNRIEIRKAVWKST